MQGLLPSPQDCANTRGGRVFQTEALEPSSGFSQRKPGKRPKLPSVVQRISLGSIARAARWASGIRFACRLWPINSVFKASRWRSVGFGIQTGEQSNHSSTCCHALSTVSGCSKIRALVTRRMKARRLGQGNPTDAVPLRRPSSHSRAPVCCGKVLTWAYISVLPEMPYRKPRR